MYGMMSTTGFSFGLTFFYGVHMTSYFIAAFGAALLLFWAFKHLAEKSLWTWGWSLLVIGSIICLLTLPAWPMFAGGMYGGNFSRMGSGMMGSWNTAANEEKSASQLQEEAEGKALYEKLQAKEVTCADLSDDDFELIGEYVMGKQSGSSHEQMNARIKQMMGDEGEVQMHIALGKNAVKCTSDAASSESIQGMMQ